MRKQLQIRGAYMSSRSTPGMLIRLIESGMLNLDQLDVKTFPLEEITEIVQQARKASALQFVALLPNK